MAGELLTLPLRIGIRGTRIFWGIAEGLTERAVMGTLQLVHVITGGDSTSSPEPPVAPGPATTERPARTRPTRREPSAPPEPAPSAPPEPAPPLSPPASSGEPAPIFSAPPAAEDAPPPVAPEPAHVSEEPELVREEAEPGAEEGAGASVRIDPPWEGYDGMAAHQVIARLSEADRAELAAIQLYESSTRRRQTVLEAVERQLKVANGRG